MVFQLLEKYTMDTMLLPFSPCSGKQQKSEKTTQGKKWFILACSFKGNSPWGGGGHHRV